MDRMTPQQARALALAVAGLRVLVGVVVLAAPRLFARLLLRERDVADRSAPLARMFGVRDATLGLGTVLAVGRGDDDVAVAGWAEAGGVSDAIDALALLAERRGVVRPLARWLVTASAAGAAVAGAAAADRLRAG